MLSQLSFFAKSTWTKIVVVIVLVVLAIIVIVPTVVALADGIPGGG
jgi:hypothetical protein